MPDIKNSIYAIKKLAIGIGIRKKFGIKKDVSIPVKRYGTQYGGWYIPEGFLNRNSVCYLAGAGTDISFDADIAANTGASVFIYDPTPRALEHYEYVVRAVQKGESAKVSGPEDYVYKLNKENLTRVRFSGMGFWKESGMVRFYEPRNPDHVSHSIVNLQNTSAFIEVAVDRLGEIMKNNGHNHIDLLKLDIEGAECEVIQSLIEDKLDIRTICVEFDGILQKMDKERMDKISAAIRSMRDFGYLLAHYDLNLNLLFIHRDCLGKNEYNG